MKPLKADSNYFLRRSLNPATFKCPKIYRRVLMEPSLFERLFGKPKKELPSDIDAIFRRVSHFLESEEAQNAALPSEVQNLLNAGGALDELPNASGLFGSSPTNPIPVNGPLGEVLYLSLLRTSAGVPLAFHRVASRNDVDEFQILSIDLKMRGSLFFDMYHTRRSRKAPDRYSLRTTLDARNPIYGTNQNLPNFPRGLDVAIRDFQKSFIGIPMALDEIRAFMTVVETAG